MGVDSGIISYPRIIRKGKRDKEKKNTKRENTERGDREKVGQEEYKMDKTYNKKQIRSLFLVQLVGRIVLNKNIPLYYGTILFSGFYVYVSFLIQINISEYVT